jgi:hypothetical protein
MRDKRLFLQASDIQPLAEGFGSCIASDRITVDGKAVGYMYRESPDSNVDSGWRFFAGDETQAYADHADNFAMYDINTIANHDRAIIELLNAPIGCAYVRNSDGRFELEPMPADPDA